MLNKLRLENLSDGLFAIVLTILVFQIKLPDISGTVTNHQLLGLIYDLSPVLIGFVVSFFVLTMFWTSHNFFYSYFAKTINRELVLLNLFYLGLISLIPFFAYVLGRFPHLSLAVALYGANILAIGLLNIFILSYALSSHEIDTSHLPPRLLAQAKIRGFLTPVCALVGILLSFVFIPAALLLYAFPVLFNIIPGSLDRAQKIFRFQIPE